MTGYRSNQDESKLENLEISSQQLSPLFYRWTQCVNGNE